MSVFLNKKRAETLPVFIFADKYRLAEPPDRYLQTADKCANAPTVVADIPTAFKSLPTTLKRLLTVVL